MGPFRIFEKNPTKIDNYGIWLRYQSRTGYHNMYKEYRDTTLNGAVEQMYTEMASRHRVRFPCIQIIKTATVPAKLCKRESTKQFHNSKIKFPLVFRKLSIFSLFSLSKTKLEMAKEAVSQDEEVVLGEEINCVRLITLNRPRQLNVISSKVVSILAEYLEKWEKDDKAKLVLIKGAGRAFSAGGDLKMFYDGRKTREFLALTGGRLNGKELVATGLATHFVPSEKFPELEKRLVSLNSGDEAAVKSAIQEFSVEVKLDEESILNKKLVIDECFSKDTVEEIIKSFEAEASKEGNGWIGPVLKGLKRSSPTGLKVTLRSIREGRNQTLAECLKKEFRLTMNILRTEISEDVYEGIRALTIDKDNAPKWEPSTLNKVEDEKLDLVFKPFPENLELQIPGKEECRWSGKYENTPYPSLNLHEWSKLKL
ncbi:hypothetical protein CDL15_Pgr002943 [Punica granatum]|uniref:3-hydroxyisobutyryl-CoA hydrolase n=1 Tax=Punica granatum TaxID=22663 RepID=A0A218X330_PUNGR|nr:hypothetical protein CDL15_Pgr002943 [Punica granatum]